MFYVSTIERVRFPADICAQLWLRTTWIRKGIIGAFGKIDAGFEGTLTLGAYNATDDPVEIPIGERFCQMVFESLNSESMQDYAKRSGNYQGQTGITLSSQPLASPEKAPEIRGALVVAEGASDPAVRLKLQRAVQAATGLPLSCIEVFEMEYPS
jgi:hypothetical protein